MFTAGIHYAPMDMQTCSQYSVVFVNMPRIAVHIYIVRVHRVQ